MLNLTGYVNKDLKAEGAKDPVYMTRKSVRDLIDRFKSTDSGLKEFAIKYADMSGQMDSILIPSQPYYLSAYLESELLKRGKKVYYAIYERKHKISLSGTATARYVFSRILPSLSNKE